MNVMRIAPALVLAALLAAGCSKKQETPENPPKPIPSGAPAVQPGGPPSPPGTTQTATGNAEKGKIVFQKNCVGCHGPDGKGKMKDQPDFTNAAWWAKEKDAELLEVIHNGHDKMPAFKGRLSEDEMRDALAYVRTFAK